MEMSILLRKSLETVLMLHLYPRSEIYVHVQVLHADGGNHDLSKSTMFF